MMSPRRYWQLLTGSRLAEYERLRDEHIQAKKYPSPVMNAIREREEDLALRVRMFTFVVVFCLGLGGAIGLRFKGVL